MSALELDDDVMYAVLQLPDMSEARERARLLAIEAREGGAAPSRDLPSYAGRDGFASFALAHLERAEALDEALNSGPPCRDPMLGGVYYAGACLERARRTYGRRPARWNVDAMCAACAASHLASMCAQSLRYAVQGERDALARVALAARRVDVATFTPAHLGAGHLAWRLMKYGGAWRAHDRARGELSELRARGALLCASCGARSGTEVHAEDCRYTG